MVASDPPGGDFKASKRTQALRPGCSLDEQQIAEARKMRKEGSSEEDVAKRFSVPIEEAQIALAGLRTPVKHPRRKSLNVGMQAHAKVKREQRAGEATWETMDRLLTELDELRGKS